MTLELSDMLDFINQNIMYFVLGCYNIGINIIYDNKICTYGIGEKNIFVYMRHTMDNRIEYYPVFIKRDRIDKFIIDKQETNVEILDATPIAMQFFNGAIRRLKLYGYDDCTLMCDKQNQCYGILGKN